VQKILEISGFPTSDSEKMYTPKGAVAIAQNTGWKDHRLGISYYNLARMMQKNDIERAHRMFQKAERVFSQSANAYLHSAFVALQLANHHIYRD
jgi:hypothetical protein